MNHARFMKDYTLKHSKVNSKYNKYFLKIIFGCFLFVLLINISTVSAVNVTVSPDGVGTDNSTINDAISHINSISDSDNTIILSEGVYNTSKDRNNNITINGNLKIIGNGSPSKVVIDGGNLGYLFKISSNSNVAFENITFINGNNDYGGAISNFGKLKVNNSIFENNTALYGGAIYSIANTYISLSNFTNNSEAIWISGINNTIISSTILNNQKGIFVNGSAKSTVINYNRILNNTLSGFDLENFGTDTNAELNWWGTNYPTQQQINNQGINFTMEYWYVLQITLNTDTYLKTTVLNFSNDVADIYLAYNLSTNKIISNNPLLLPAFNVTVICPWNNIWNRNIQTWSIAWGTGSRWGLPINEYNTYYSVKAFVDNEYILVEINYTPPNLTSSDIKSNTSILTQLSAKFLTNTGKPIYNKTIEFWVNGIHIGSNKTDANGLAIYHYIFDKEGVFDIQAIFSGDESYSNSTATSQAVISITIPPENNEDNLNETNEEKDHNEETESNEPNDDDNSNNQLKNNINNSPNNNSKINASMASMKKTSIPIVAMLLAILLVGGSLRIKKK